MKLVYIAGLDHSGSTLTAHLLGGHPLCLGLGEVASFFSPPHMDAYMQRWGTYSDVRRCSCGREWTECDFWSDLVPWCGLHSNAPLMKKYAALLERVEDVYGRDTVVLDSSKSLPVLEILNQNAPELLGVPDDLFVALTIKDARSFAMSMARKYQKWGTFPMLRSFNLWLSVNKRFISLLHEFPAVGSFVNLYERLCADPDIVINSCLRKMGVPSLSNADLTHNRSHIVLGKKNFIVRNRKRVSYDFEWYNNDAVNLAYLLHWRARKFNKYMYELSQNCLKQPG